MPIKQTKGNEVEAPSLKASAGRLDERGREIVDSRPMEPPVGWTPPMTLVDQIRAMVREERIRAELQSAGVETFDEADDFDVGDDYDPKSPYEEYFEPTPNEELQGLVAPKAEPTREPPSEGSAQPPQNEVKQGA